MVKGALRYNTFLLFVIVLCCSANDILFRICDYENSEKKKERGGKGEQGGEVGKRRAKKGEVGGCLLDFNCARN